MTEQSKSITRLQKDNLTNIRSQNEIDRYFAISNPDGKKRHYLFFKIEIFNLLLIIFALIISPLTNIKKFTWISVLTGIVIISFVLFKYNKASYRFLTYFIDIFGLFSVLFIHIYGNFSFLSNIEFIDAIIVVFQVIIISIDTIFLFFR